MIGVSASRNCSIKIRQREFENASCISSRNVYSFHTRRVRRNVIRLGLIRMCSTNHGHPCRTWHRVDERHWNKEGPRGMMSFRVPKRCPILNGESPFVEILSLSRKRERATNHYSFSRSIENAKLSLYTSEENFQNLFPVYATGGEGERGSGPSHNTVRVRLDPANIRATCEDRRGALLQSNDATRVGILFATGVGLGTR